MEIITITDKTAEIQLTLQEIIILKNAVNQVFQRFANVELNARLGVSPEEIKEISQLIEKLIQEIN